MKNNAIYKASQFQFTYLDRRKTFNKTPTHSASIQDNLQVNKYLKNLQVGPTDLSKARPYKVSIKSKTLKVFLRTVSTGSLVKLQCPTCSDAHDVKSSTATFEIQNLTKEKFTFSGKLKLLEECDNEALEAEMSTQCGNCSQGWTSLDDKNWSQLDEEKLRFPKNVMGIDGKEINQDDNCECEGGDIEKRLQLIKNCVNCKIPDISTQYIFLYKKCPNSQIRPIYMKISKCGICFSFKCKVYGYKFENGR